MLIIWFPKETKSVKVEHRTVGQMENKTLRFIAVDFLGKELESKEFYKKELEYDYVIRLRLS